LDRYLHQPAADPGADADAADAGDGTQPAAAADAGARDAAHGPAADRGAHAARIQELMSQAIGQPVKLVPGPAGPPSHLPRPMLGAIGFGGPSLPLDLGDVDTIPWWLRRAVTTRDQGCAWPGGCDQPASATQPHHVAHRAHQGPTSLSNLLSLC